MAKIIVLGSSAEFPLPRTRTNKFEDYLDITGYRRRFELHDDRLCASAKRDGKNRRTRACLAVVTGEGTILLDAGPDIKYQLRKFRLRPSAVFITHEHPDANYGLQYLPKSVRVYSEKLGNVKHGWAIKIFGIEIMPFRVVHSKIAPYSGYCIKLKAENYKLKTIAYITDMASVRGIKKIVQNCEVLFADGSILKRNLGGHLSIENQLKIYKKWRLKRVIFTHIGHATLPHEELVKYIKGRYKNAEVAYDGMKINLYQIKP